MPAVSTVSSPDRSSTVSDLTPVAEQGSLLTPEGASITTNTMCLVVEKGRFGVKRKASTDDVSVKSDKTLLALTKVIIESPELQAVVQHDAAVAAFLRSKTVHSDFKGLKLIPIKAVVEVHDFLTGASVKRQELVEKACDTYRLRCDETAARLSVLQNPGDYPPLSRFRASFYFEWKFVTWETPSKLKDIHPAIFRMEQEKAAKSLSGVADECRNAMRAGMADLVDLMVDKLTPDADGKKKTFSKATIRNFNEFFDMFELKDVTGDAELGVVVTKARDVLSGVDAKDIRSNEAIRDAMKQQFAMLRDKLSTMKIDRGDRDIDLEDGDDA
jgi:hypothetical protein